MIRSQTKAQPKMHEYQMKYRLTGVSIIVGFAIILISVLLKEPSIETKDISKNGSGWTVRVGTYSEKENVDKVSALLNSRGFDAQHVKVEIALGVATLIWLGPYTNKKTAEKVSLRLKEITGEKGYVTETSS